MPNARTRRALGKSGSYCWMTFTALGPFGPSSDS
jgi:hypothetical protein